MEVGFMVGFEIGRYKEPASKNDVDKKNTKRKLQEHEEKVKLGVKDQTVKNKNIAKIREPTVTEVQTENIHSRLEIFRQSMRNDSQNSGASTNTEVKRILPKWILKPRYIENDEDRKKSEECMEMIDKKIRENLTKMNITSLFPVQTAMIPEILKGCKYGLGELNYPPGDLCCRTATGSGKTLAFAIPIVHAIMTSGNDDVTQAIVMLPEGKLAEQVHNVFTQLCMGTIVKCALINSSSSMFEERKSLIMKNKFGWKRSANIVVCTPKRLVEHLEHTPDWKIEYLRFLVIDEVDRSMELFEHNWLQNLTSKLKSGGFTGSKRNLTFKNCIAEFKVPEIPLQKLLFSSILSSHVEKLYNVYSKYNLFHPRLFVPGLLEEHMIICEDKTMDKLINALHLILSVDSCLVFTDSKNNTELLSSFVQYYIEHDPNQVVRHFSSSTSPKNCSQTFKKFKDGKINVLICSDAAARGLDVVDVDNVILYDVPSLVETYVHRVGRTARAGKKGNSYTLMTIKQEKSFKKMFEERNFKLPKEVKPLEGDTKKGYLEATNSFEIR